MTRKTQMTLLLFVVPFALVALATPHAFTREERIPPKHVTSTGQSTIPVLVELFTSEGCSSCPPADILLAELAAEQPVPGVEIVPLAFHVDYWDRLGWKDRFSSKRFTQRQRRYSWTLKRYHVYTPQMVVDGSDEFVGSDSNQAYRSIKQAANSARGRIRLDAAISSKNSKRLDLRIQVSSLPSGADAVTKPELLVALAEDGLTSGVERGENAGRVLRHAAVARLLKNVGQVRFPLAEPYEFTARLKLKPEWNLSKLSAIAFVQDRESLRILATSKVKIITE